MSDAATMPKNDVKVTDAGPSRKKLTITIPAEVVGEKLRDSMSTLAVEAQIPGFRKGKAPRELLEKRFGGAMRSETKGQLVASAYQAAIEDLKLKVVGEPISPGLEKIDLKEGQGFTFDLEVEVVPEFDLPSLEGIAVKRPIIEIADAAVEEEITKLRVNEGTLEERETPEAGDYLTGHGVMVGKDGTTFYDIKGCVVQKPAADKKGKGMILGVAVDDFDKQLGSPKAGKTVTIKTKGPEGHEVEGIRGNDLTITFSVDRVDRIVPAEVSKIVSMFGMSDEGQLRDTVRQRLTERAKVQQQVAMRQQVAKHLLDSVKMDLPERLATHQSARNLEQRRMELMYRGVDPQKIEEHIAELRAASAGVAVRDLKLFFILHKAAEALNVSVTEGEMNQRIAMMAYERNVRPEALRKEIISRNQGGAIYTQVREHKTMDAILAKASVTDMPADAFNAAMKALNEGKQA
ncbi:MAG: trigger factor [Phycisphaeraceae bacterium]|nr:MAG: trigger factor [Phycisphaeraceae bacterium]